MKMSTFGPVRGSKLTVTQAAKQSLSELGMEPKLAIIFTPIEANQQEIIAAIRSLTQAPIIGATSGGAVFTDKGISAGEVAGAFIGGEYLSVSCCAAKDMKSGMRTSVAHALSKITPMKHTGHALFVLSDAFAGDGETLIKEIKNLVPIHWPIFGGFAGDGWKFEKSKVIFNDEVFENGAVFAYINDMGVPSIGVRHGFEAVEGGEDMKVTDAEGNTVKKINDRPAAEVYMEQLIKLSLAKAGDNFIQSAANYPLGIKIPWGEKLKIRTPMSSAGGDVTFAGAIPKGSRVSIVRSDTDKMITAAKNMMSDTVAAMRGKQPTAQIVVDCAGRWKTLGQRYPEQINAFKEGMNHPLIGFASYGEIAKYSGSLEGFHNTTTVTALW
jgi:hypothetical protein